MTEPTIICPSCKSEIKLTESLAAPLIEATRRQYEQKFAQKESEITKRETALKQQKDALEKAQESIDEQVAVKLKSERASIASQEAKKAREALSDEIGKAQLEKAEVQELLKQRDAKLSTKRSNPVA